MLEITQRKMERIVQKESKWMQKLLRKLALRQFPYRHLHTDMHV